MKRLCLAAVVSCLAAPAAVAQEHFTEGPVWECSSYRTKQGHFDDYMKYLRQNYLPQAQESKKAGLTLEQMDIVELNEAFAAQVLAVLKELPIDPERLNVNGGAIALGHPLGCTGAKLTTSLLYEMKRRRSRYGLVTMCIGGGMGAAGILERLV